jgi:O-antigen/teichoic acid export membrane protein
MTRIGQTLVLSGNLSRTQGSDGEVARQAHGRSLHSNFAWTLSGNMVYAACQWGMLIVLARMGSAEMVGQFALALSIITPVLMFTNLQLRSVQATDARGEYSFRDYLALRLFMAGAAMIIIGITALVTAPTAATLAVILVLAVAKGVEAISEIYYGLLQQHERMDRIAISLLLKGVVSLAALALAIYFSNSILWGSVALLIAALAVLVAFDQCSAKLVSGPASGEKAERLPRWQFQSLAKLTLLALPLGLVVFLIALSANIPRYFIEHYQGLSDLGVFAALSYLIVAGNRIVNALGESSSPRLAKYYAAGDYRQFRRLLLRLMLFGALLGIATIAAVLVAGKELLTFFYGAEYAEHTTVLFWVAIAGSIGYLASFLGYAMTAARYFLVQTPLFLVVALSTVIACVFLVPEYGLHGAAWALGAGMLVQLAGSAAVVAYLLARPAERRQP